MVGLVLAAQLIGRSAGNRCSRAVPERMPNCRTAEIGANESFPPRLTAYDLFKPDWPLNVNPSNGARRWPLRNSLGQTFAWIEQRWDARLREPNRTTRWVVYQPDGRTPIDGRSFPTRASRESPSAPYLAIQGYGCVLAPDHRLDPMVALLHGELGDAGRSLDVRGFIDRAALPSAPGALSNPGAPEYARRVDGRGPTRGAPLARVLAEAAADTGCTQSDLSFFTPRESPSEERVRELGGRLLDPAFQWYYHYNGAYPGHPGRRVYEPTAHGQRRVLRDPLGNRYANYARFPLPPIDARTGLLPAGHRAPRDPFPQARLEATTTGLRGGGIVRAIVPLGSRYRVLDAFPYADPNGYCGRESDPRFAARARVARWVLVRIEGERIEGWVPRKVPDRRYDRS